MNPEVSSQEIDELSAMIRKLNLNTNRICFLKGIVEGWAIDEESSNLQPTG